MRERSRRASWQAALPQMVWRPFRSLFTAEDDQPLDLQLVGRTVLHAIAVGLTVGLAGCLLLTALDAVETALLEHLARYPHLRAAGERGEPFHDGDARMWLVALLPMVGALIGGLVSHWAPEVRGGGGDAMIEAFHHHGGDLRPRVIALKPLASISTLAFGGAGGREGPTMQLGGGIGASVARLLRTTARERRVLMIAGVAAGISAVFRTPLGAALLAIEVLYRDDFEAEALIPAVLASVVAYSLSATLISTSPMFGRLPAYPFAWQQLPFYALAAIAVAAGAAAFVGLLHRVQRSAAKLPGPAWLRPAFGGLALGLVAVLVLIIGPTMLHVPPALLGVLGGGYGAAQLAIVGDPALGVGVAAAAILAVLAMLRACATSLTIGTGGSAGDFAPALAVGALLGGAIGHLASPWLPSISPGAFALVGMATFYGGAAKVPLASTVMVCEMAGSYDLLVPLMLSQAIAFVALRRFTLYPAQVASQRHSPVHAVTWARQDVVRVQAAEVLVLRPVVVLGPQDDAGRILDAMANAPDQPVFPVIAGGTLVGLITGPATREIASRDGAADIVASDLMVPPVTVAATATLDEVARALVSHDLRALPVVDDTSTILGLIDEHDVSRAYLGRVAAVAA